MQILQFFFLVLLNLFCIIDCCWIFSTFNSSICKTCQYQYYYDFPLTDPNSEFPENSCKKITINSAITYKIYITDKTGDCLNCTGTISNPYNNIITAFITTWKKSITNLETNLYFYLIGSSHYINKNDWGSQNTVNIFRRIYSNITLAPLSCADYNILGCFDKNYPVKPIIYLKTDQFYLFIGYQMYVLNLIFDGSDIQMANFTTTETRNTKICQFYDLNQTFLHNYNNSKANCFLRNKIINTSNDSLSLFNLEVIMDDFFHSASIKPTIFIQDCEFIYIHSFNSVNKGYKSLISGMTWSHRVYIYRTKIDYFYMVNGIYNSRNYDKFLSPIYKNDFEYDGYIY